MKRLALLGLLAAGTTLLAGCPIFDDSSSGPGCFDNCGTGGSPTTSGTCGAQKDCTGINETCGADGFCHTGDCTLWGCVGGQSCTIGVDQKASCGDAPSHGGAGGASMGGASMGGAATGGAAMGGASSSGGTGGVGPAGGSGGSGPAGGSGGATATGGSGGVGPAGGSGGVGGM